MLGSHCVSSSNKGLWTSRFTVALLLAVGVSQPVLADKKATKVIVEPVEVWDKGINTTLYCQVSTPFNFKVTSHANAELTEILPVGSKVQKGQVLAKQDGFYLSRDIEVKKIDIEQAQSSLEYYQSEFERLTSLKSKDMASESEHNRLKQQFNIATNNQKRLKQQLAVLENRYSRLNHVAPFYGQVVKLDAQLGEQLSNGSSILTLLPLNQKQIECKLPLDDFAKVKDIHALDFTYGQQALRLRDFSERIDETSQNVTLFFSYQDTASDLLVGQRMQMTMSQKRDNASRIPYDAVKLESDKVGNKTYSTWMVNQNDEAVKVPLKILATSATHFIVESDLKAGDSVIVRGSSKLKPSQKVMPVKKVLL